jgi:hypothetical protein
VNATVPEILRAAADLIEPEGAWTQGAFSRNADGTTDIDEAVASNPVCWCALGALAKASGVDPLDPRAFVLPAPQIAAYPILRRLVGGDFVFWNDAPKRTQAEVVAKLREAADLAEQVQP